MPNDERRSLLEILEEMLVEYEVFVSNSEQLIKEAKAIMRKQKRNKK